MIKNQACIGIFVIFTCKRLLWVINNKGKLWTGQYVRDMILTENVIPFLKNEEKVVDVDESIFVYDVASCMPANTTQHSLYDNAIQF